MYTYFDLGKYDYPMEEVFEGEDFMEITRVTITDQRRWTTTYSKVLQEKATGHFWLAQWSQGSTEYQETDPDLTLILVEPVEIIKTEYHVVCTTKQV